MREKCLSEMRIKISLLVCLLWAGSCFGQSGARIMALMDVIQTAQDQSIDGMVARNQFLSDYWGYRAFRAEQLPSLNLRSNLGNFNRSLIPLQNAESGSISYRENFNLRNQASLSIDQNIGFTGGKVSLYSSLERLDQYAPNRMTTYYSQPVTLSYLQPLWSFNRLKWDRKIEPERYEQAKRVYLESMEQVTVRAVTLFFELALEQINRDIALKNYANTRSMYVIAQKRFSLGSVKQNDLMQLELRMLNDSLSINTSQLQYSVSRNRLRSFLGYTDAFDLELHLPDNIPDLEMNYENVLNISLTNSSFALSQKIQELEAEMGIDQAKANRGITAQINTQFGLSRSTHELQTVYQGLLDQEIFGLSLSIPLMDWGMGRGRVKMAKAKSDVVHNKIMQAFTDYQQDVFMEVMQFNGQRRQCELSKRANVVANDRYRITLENFANGTVTVTDLNTAQSEKDEANRKYINQLQNYWLYYYQIRKKTLYDFISKTNISTQFDQLVE